MSSRYSSTVVSIAAFSKPRGTLLVCDDEEGPRQSLAVIFGRDGEYDVLLAEDGPTAIDIARSHHIDVAILDIRMAGMSGMEVLEKLKQMDPTMEVIMMTAYETTDTMRQALRLRVGDYINKPFDLPTMREAVKSAMLRRTLLGTKTAVPLLANPAKAEDDLTDQVLAETTSAFIHKLINDFANLNHLAQQMGELIHEVEGEQGIQLQTWRNKFENSLGATRYLLQRFRNVAGRHPGVLKPVDIFKVLVEVKDHLAASFSKPVNLTLPGDRFEIMGDYELLWHLFENLVRNGLEAIKGRDDGCIIVTAEIHDSVRQVWVTVRDNGTGIPPDVLPRIFDPKFSTKPKGLGVGLHLVRRAAHIHGGQVECKSNLKIGTDFTVRLSFGPETKDAL